MLLINKLFWSTDLFLVKFLQCQLICSTPSSFPLISKIVFSCCLLCDSLVLVFQHAARYLVNQDWVKNDSLKTVENTAVRPLHFNLLIVLLFHLSFFYFHGFSYCFILAFRYLL